VSDTQDPWVDVKQTRTGLGQKGEPADYDSRLPWQALFASQVCIKSFEERIKKKWGFSASFLHEEALDRQKLFIESQCLSNPQELQFTQRTLALRCIGVPLSGLLLSLIGKVYSESQDGARQAALIYWREIKSIFPYDYILYPAISYQEYLRFSGKEILNQCNKEASFAQIQRFENAIRTSQSVIPMMGIWQTGIRSDEQVWRVIAGSSKPILFNIFIRPTVLLEEERHILWGMRQPVRMPNNSAQKALSGQIYDEWANALMSQHRLPWNRFFILQVHLAAPDGIDEYLLRAIGSALTRDNSEQSSSGFQIEQPSKKEEVVEWSQNISQLEVFQPKNNIGLARLSNIVDLNEAHSVFRFPYPPESGLPDVQFLDKVQERI
jgi:hypothetical protein